MIIKRMSQTRAAERSQENGNEIRKSMKRRRSSSPELQLLHFNALINTPPKRIYHSPNLQHNDSKQCQDKTEIDLGNLIVKDTDKDGFDTKEVIFKAKSFYKCSEVNDRKQELKKKPFSVCHSVKKVKRKTVKKKKETKKKLHLLKKKSRWEEPTIKMEKSSICEDLSVSPKFQYKPKYEKSPVSENKKKKFFTHRAPLNSSPSKLPKIVMKLGHRRLSMPFKINAETKKKLEKSPEKKNKRLKPAASEGSLLPIVSDPLENSGEQQNADSSSDEEMILISRCNNQAQSPSSSDNEQLITPFTLSKSRTLGNITPKRSFCNIPIPTSSTKDSGNWTSVSLRGRKKKMDGLEQLIIDAGQKEVGAVTCNTCGMIFTACDEEDSAAHIRHHNKILFHLKFQGWKKERVLKEFHDGRILSIHPDDPTYAQQKLEEVLSVVDSDLGFVDVGIRNKSKCKFYLFISFEKRVVGCLIAELITQANRIIEDDSQTNVKASDNRKTWCCKTESEKAICGISRIWTLATHRRKQIATRMVDCLRETFVFGYVLNMNDIAFSDPTPYGRLFASSYTNMSTFLVYK